MKSATVLTTALLILALRAPAQISTDGTLGQSINLPGPNFQITPDLGQQHGQNLFHSFYNFNLSSHESATFSGPSSVQNILSRVTGGNPSHIDGLFRSTISGANMYFLNPYGILFGPNARLDVQGSFHASTADYLRLDEGGRFDVRNPSDSILTVAPIESFGFLTDSPAMITIQDSTLSVPKKETLSLIGGDLDINSNSPVMVNQSSFIALPDQPKLSSSSGQINLISMASKGEVVSDELGFSLSAKGGQITINNHLIEVNGIIGGKIDIRGGKLVMRDSLLQANTLGPKNGQGITLDLQEAIDIKADSATVVISFDTFDSGHAGSLTITTPQLEITKAGILTKSVGTGQAGEIKIVANQITLKEGGSIVSVAIKEGNAGDITLKITDRLNLTGFYPGIVDTGFYGKFLNLASGIRTFTIGTGRSGNLLIETNHLNMDAGKIDAATRGQGNGGNIIIRAKNISLINGAGIHSNSAKKGNGGQIILDIAESMTIAGTRNQVSANIDLKRQSENSPSIVASLSKFGSAGEAGQIVITVPTLIMENNAVISTSTGGTGDGGELTIIAETINMSSGAQIESKSGFSSGGHVHTSSGQGGTLHLKAAENITISGDNSGVFSTTSGVGEGGNLYIETNSLTITNNGILTTGSQGLGNAGNITLQVDIINLTEQGQISTEAKNAAGGNIVIESPYLLYLPEGKITTSVGTGKGRGGNITIKNPTFVVMNGSKIIAQADEGHGGDIYIVADQFIASSCSQISASSKLGVDGEVDIESPAVNLDDFLVALPGSDDEVQLQFPKGCTAEYIFNPGTTFNVRTVREGRIKSPEGFME